MSRHEQPIENTSHNRVYTMAAKAINELLDHALPATALSIAALALAGCGSDSGSSGYTEKGVVVVGANNKEYVIPKGAERPVYASLQACETDVTDQIGAVDKKVHLKLKLNPNTLCQPVKEFTNDTTSAYLYPLLWFYGPIINPSSRWTSPYVSAWQTSIPNRTFAPTDENESTDELGDVADAPSKSQIGETEEMTEGDSELGEAPEAYGDAESAGDTEPTANEEEPSGEESEPSSGEDDPSEGVDEDFEESSGEE